MAEIKSYKPSTNSISEGQVLTCPYPNDKAKLIVREMAEILMFRLTEKKLVAESITLEVGYDRENVDKGGYRGLTQTDRYGRIIPKAAHGTVRFDAPTNLGSTIINESAKLFERISLCRYIVFIMPLAWVLCRQFGPVGVWNAFWATEVLSAIVSLIVYKKSV